MSTTDDAAGGLPRRGFFRKGLWGGALLLVLGGTALPIALCTTLRRGQPRRPLRLLSLDEHAIFAAVAARVVPGAGAGPRWPSAEAMDCAGKVDELMAQVHPAIGSEFRQLLRLFENGLTGLFSARTPRPFTRCTPADQDARLEAWRRSRLALFRTGYQAMARLAHATYHSSAEIYPLVGYPGPPIVPAVPG